ncbi:UNVERIFIED_CONTAM: hypothetical protein Sradi_3605100 [Sesamum radiatum]|uniref:Uncharacterized protein n=1 Tax=Sesamum radiatum TaxID=300843 RepID=A0AAW2QHW0_SESRA
MWQKPRSVNAAFARRIKKKLKLKPRSVNAASVRLLHLSLLLHGVDFGLGCVIPSRQRRSSGENEEKGGDCGGCSLEHNKAWLLAESGGCGAEEPHSVHSSFRFSFCSQVELESMTVNNSSSATVLMVNLDNGLLADSKSRELKWRRIESLERSISPVANSLIRFSYSEILSATRNFSNGTQ